MSDTAAQSAQHPHEIRFPRETAAYRAARDALLREEIALRAGIERVARLRRDLPPGGEIPEDYVFAEGEDAHAVRLSELFGGNSTLIVYSFMYGQAMDRPCPNCTSILDALDGEAKHVNQRASFAVVAKSPIARIRAFARERGWRSMRLLSSANNRYNADYHGENAAGAQTSNLNVFSRADGVVRHTYSTEMNFVPSGRAGDPRHVDSIWPLWGLLDFTPEGRGEDHPKLQYDNAPA